MTAFGEYAEDGTASAMKARDHKDATDLIVDSQSRKAIRRGGSFNKGEPIAARNSGQGYWVEDDVAATLGTEARAVHEGTLAFSCKDNGRDVAEDVAPTLRSMNADKGGKNGGGQMAVCFKPSHYTRDKDGAPSEITPPLTADADKGDQDPVVMAYDMTHGDDPMRPTGDKTNTLQNRMGTGGNQVPVVQQVQFSSGGGKVENDTAQTLRAGAEHNYQFARVGMAVRRLTPVECERLQGFPDNWTAGFSDSCRYRMLGNAVCVNVSEWLGHRISRVWDTLIWPTLQSGDANA